MRSLFKLMFGSAQTHVAPIPTAAHEAGPVIALPAVIRLIQPTPSGAQPHESTMHHRRQLPAARLSHDGLHPTEVAQLCAVHRSTSVQHAAEALQYELRRLVDASALGLIAEAVRRADHDAVSLTPELVLAKLLEMRSDVAGEITAAGDERTAHLHAISRALAPLQPLLSAVTTRASKAATERDSLMRTVQALKQGAPCSGAQRYQELARHLTDEQIATLGIAQPEVDNAPRIASANTRIAELDSLLAACNAFQAHPAINVQALAGLGFEDEIEAARTAGAVFTQ